MLAGKPVLTQPSLAAPESGGGAWYWMYETACGWASWLADKILKAVCPGFNLKRKGYLKNDIIYRIYVLNAAY
ncbi:MULTISPECIES: hypothetical protein [Rhizobium/Agrobacterium group]|uniref:hypothetical protein n=1 Tax=Rhizobium/Agrobacterium group TaxID=227290 RepID=UPI001178486E|nr:MULTISPECIES: hypothetical protein [Rhizobium/Agrobacterium group]MCF1484001.1 hypothetical protein [Allorhizobium ampelinum]NSZ45830.1 hypothetical protein [Agrobacterium vitis]NTA29546.1 hypothetical protein [Allorhizobium ampelinum]